MEFGRVFDQPRHTPDRSAQLQQTRSGRRVCRAGANNRLHGIQTGHRPLQVRNAAVYSLCRRRQHQRPRSLQRRLRLSDSIILN